MTIILFNYNFNGTDFCSALVIISVTLCDRTIVSSGGGMAEAQKGTEMLQKAGVSVEFIDLRTRNPMDTETLVKSVQRWIASPVDPRIREGDTDEDCEFF